MLDGSGDSVVTAKTPALPLGSEDWGGQDWDVRIRAVAGDGDSPEWHLTKLGVGGFPGGSDLSAEPGGRGFQAGGLACATAQDPKHCSVGLEQHSLRLIPLDLSGVQGSTEGWAT